MLCAQCQANTIQLLNHPSLHVPSASNPVCFTDIDRLLQGAEEAGGSRGLCFSLFLLPHSSQQLPPPRAWALVMAPVSGSSCHPHGALVATASPVLQELYLHLSSGL